MNTTQLNQFEQFWRTYPRRIGKGAARKAFEKALKLATAEEIMAGITRQISYYSSREQQFIPHPSTWLNQERWSDEPQPVRSRAGDMEGSRSEPRKSAYREHQEACARELDKIINRDAGHDERNERPDNVIDIGTADYRVERTSASRWR